MALVAVLEELVHGQSAVLEAHFRCLGALRRSALVLKLLAVGRPSLLLEVAHVLQLAVLKHRAY